MKRGQGKQKLDGMRSLDLRYLHRSGMLRSGQVSVHHWFHKGKEWGRFIVTAAEDHIIAQSAEVTEFIELTRIGCHLGGTRPFMKCPHCDRQVLLLYLGPTFFRCRHCYRLTYESRNERQFDLQLRRAQKARAKLGAPANLTVAIPPKAKWKHHSKYQRLRAEAEAEKCKVFGMLDQKLQARRIIDPLSIMP